MVSVTKPRSNSLRRFDWTRSTPTDEFQKRTKDVDWSKSPLGPIAEWPASLRQLVLLSTANPSPTAVVYGTLDQPAIVFNETFSKLLGSRHVNLQGRLVRNELLDLCAEFDNVWQRQVSNGCAEIVKNQKVRSDRLGFVEEKLYTWKFVPIIGDDGLVAGSMVTVDEENKLPPRRERSKSAVRELGNAVRSAIDRTANQTAVNIRRLDEHFSGRACNCEKLWEASKLLERNEERYEKFADHAPVGIVALDKSYEVEWANKSFYDITSLPPDSKSLLSYIHPDDVADVRGYFDSGCSETAFTFECRLKKYAPAMSPSTSEGPPELLPSWVLVSGYKEDDYEQHTMVWIIDITSHKHAEDVLRKRMDEAIEEKQQKERFIDMTSHEVRNPLSAIVHCTDDIINEARSNSASSSSILEAAETIAYCTQHIRNIVGDVLTLSKLDSRLVEICPVPSRPREVVQEALKIFQGELRAGDIELDFEQDESLRELDIEWLLFDPNRMLQVLINLVTNAIKVVKGQPKRKISVKLSANTFAPCGNTNGIQCVRPRQDPKPVDFGECLNQEQPIYLMVQVEDTGPGLDSEEMASLFKRFTEANPKTESKYGGSGLGLFISRDLTELQGGRIGVASTPGEGSTFVFSVETRRTTAPQKPQRVPSLEIPTRLRGSSTSDSPVIAAPTIRPALISQQDAPSWHRASNTPKADSPNNAQRAARRILIVEDNLLNQKVLAKQLRKRGFEVDVALHGGEALERLNITPTTPEEDPMDKANFDCVLMDIEMPVMDGLTCVKKIRELELQCRTRPLPVIAVTANARDEQGMAALEAGMQAITTKPYKIDDLVAQMERVCTPPG